MGGGFSHISIEYTRIMEKLYASDEFNDEFNKRLEEYRAIVIGNNPLVSAPKEYSLLTIIKELGVSIKEWYSYNIVDRAKLTAHYHLKIMSEVIDNHYREQRRINKGEN